MTFKRLCLNIIKAAYPRDRHKVGWHSDGTFWSGDCGTKRRNGVYVEATADDGTCKRYYAPSYEQLYRKLLRIKFKG